MRTILRPTKPEPVRHVDVGTGNVFADLGLPDPEIALVKSDLVRLIRKQITARKLSYARAGKLLGLTAERVESLVCGDVRRCSLDRMFRFVNALGLSVDIAVRPETAASNGKPVPATNGTTKPRPAAAATRRTAPPPDVTPGSDNIFADLGLPNPDLELAKTDLLICIRNTLDARNLSKAKAAAALDLDADQYDRLFRGQFKPYTLDRLFRFLMKLDLQIEITVRPDPADPQVRVV